MNETARHGVYFALSAYLFWGVAPVYFKWLSHVSPVEILSHRVIWSVVLLMAILAVQRQLASLRVSPTVLGRLAITAVLVSANWLIFIYAILSDRIVETALGYFINPLVSVFLGVIFLKEKLRPLQWIAIVVAGSGIAFQLYWHGSIPLLALGLAFSFGFYGLMRKNLNLPAATGLGLETLLVSPIALVGLAWMIQSGDAKFMAVSLSTDFLLVLGGFVTSFPLLCFAAAVTRLPLSIMGMFQYIAPSMSLVIGVVFYGEPFGIDRWVTFTLIWIALAIFTAEGYYQYRRVTRQLDDSPARA